MAWAKYKEVAPTVRQQFRDANYLDRHKRGELQQRLRRARLAVFDARLQYGNEENSFVDAAKEKEKQISKEVALLTSNLDSKLASLRKANQGWDFEFKTPRNSITCRYKKSFKHGSPTILDFGNHFVFMEHVGGSFFLTIPAKQIVPVAFSLPSVEQSA